MQPQEPISRTGELRTTLDRAASSDLPFLIQDETGKVWEGFQQVRTTEVRDQNYLVLHVGRQRPDFQNVI